LSGLWSLRSVCNDLGLRWWGGREAADILRQFHSSVVLDIILRFGKLPVKLFQLPMTVAESAKLLPGPVIINISVSVPTPGATSARFLAR